MLAARPVVLRRQHSGNRTHLYAERRARVQHTVFVRRVVLKRKAARLQAHPRPNNAPRVVFNSWSSNRRFGKVYLWVKNRQVSYQNISAARTHVHPWCFAMRSVYFLTSSQNRLSQIVYLFWVPPPSCVRLYYCWLGMCKLKKECKTLYRRRGALESAGWAAQSDSTGSLLRSEPLLFFFFGGKRLKTETEKSHSMSLRTCPAAGYRPLHIDWQLARPVKPLV